MTKWVNRGLRKHLLLGVACLVADPAFRGQILHSTGTRPSFEVATIKPWKPVAPPPSQEGGGVPKKVMKASPVGDNPKISDRVQFIGQTALLIQSAYNLPAGSGKRIVGAPNWVESESNRYQIQAKIEDSLYAAMQSMPSAQRLEQIAWMEQSLLANRFKLRLHFETRDMPVYALVVAKGGPKLTAAKDGEPATLSALANGRGSDMTAKAVTLAEFANSPLLASATGGRPVVDQTGLQGRYSFKLTWESEQLITQGASEETVADAPSFFTAIQEQLGLRIVSSKAPVEVVVIDHIEQPSDN